MVDLRTGWLGAALCTAVAERDAAEDAVAALYRLLDRPPPRFCWVPSPDAATTLLPDAATTLRSDGPWPFQTRLASLMSDLRNRLDRRIGCTRRTWNTPPPADPVAVLRSAADPRPLLETGVFGVLRRVVRDSIAGPVRAQAADALGLTWYGQHDADWVAYYDIHRRVLGTRFDPGALAQLDLWTALARSCGWWWPRRDVCVLAERPVVLRTEPVPDSSHGEVRLHCADGPAVGFGDGWAVYSWHGTRVPSWVIEAPTAELIGAEPNVEVRRCAIERMGWAAFIEQAGLRLVSRAPDPGNPGAELLLYDLPYRSWGRPSRLLLTANGSAERDGTRRRYGLRVPHWLDDPIDAAGWSYGLSGARYATLQRRT